MNMDILAILMVAFGLFAILLFILFYIYARDARNKKRNNEEVDFEEISAEDVEKIQNIDKDSDNLVDEDVDKSDLFNLNVETDQIDDFKDDGSLIKEDNIVEANENNYSKEDIDEFVPKKKVG